MFVLSINQIRTKINILINVIKIIFLLFSKKFSLKKIDKYGRGNNNFFIYIANLFLEKNNII